MRKSILITLALILYSALYGQSTLYKGVVFDAEYKTPVAYGAVFLEQTPFGTVTNNVGEFSFTAPDSLKNRRLVAVREGFTLKYISLENLETSDMRVELQPNNQEVRAILLQDSLTGKAKAFATFLDNAVNFVMNDWIPLGNPGTNKFDLGRIQTFPTYNLIEGIRLRAGIASNSRLSPHFFMKGYAAYGFKDHKFKYRGEAIYSFDEKVYHEEEFPRNNLRLVYENDLYSPGEIHPRSPNDLLFVTYIRSLNEATYRNFAEISYEKEYKTGFAHTFWVRQSRFVPQGELEFNGRIDDMVIPHEELKTSDVGVLLRYSVREAYMQQKRKRKPIDLTSPVFFFPTPLG
jgi:hypothetical protein